MKKTIMTVLVILLALTPIIAKENTYNDLYKFMLGFIETTEKFVDEMNNAESGKEVAKAINKFTKTFIKFTKKMERLEKKYPDLDESQLPEKFTSLESRFEALGDFFLLIEEKREEYADDPDVIEAIDNFYEQLSI